MNKKYIIGISVFDRIKEAGLTQKILTEYADCIKTRLGFHELSIDKCSRNGIIMLEMIGNEERIEMMLSKLSEIGGIESQKMIFNLN